jgi:hypothetical protein
VLALRPLQVIREALPWALVPTLGFSHKGGVVGPEMMLEAVLAKGVFFGKTCRRSSAKKSKIKGLA